MTWNERKFVNDVLAQNVKDVLAQNVNDVMLDTACGPYGLGWNQADLAAFYPVRDDRAGLLRNPGSSPTDFLPNHRGKSIGVASSWMARFPTALLSIL